MAAETSPTKYQLLHHYGMAMSKLAGSQADGAERMADALATALAELREIRTVLGHPDDRPETPVIEMARRAAAALERGSVSRFESRAIITRL
jgi:hypothetical protein